MSENGALATMVPVVSSLVSFVGEHAVRFQFGPVSKIDLEVKLSEHPSELRSDLFTLQLRRDEGKRTARI